MAAPIEIACPEESPVKIVKWKVKKDSMVMKGSILGLYESRKTKSHVKLKSTATGIVDEIFVEAGAECKPGMVVVTLRQQTSGGCTHPTVMKDMCADCGADLRRESGIAGDRREKMSASVAMVHNIPELIVSQEQALELGREDEQRLLKTRKLVLLVDLDQTLIHTTNDDIPPRLKDVYHFQLCQGPQWYHTKLRPYTHAFLERVSKMYELHICTFGVRLYAHTVARLMDPDEKFFSHRILSRDECFDPLSKTANLKALFPCGDAMVCIIDDREDVWNRAPNLVHVKPYRFFQGTADINAPPGLEKSENDAIPITHKVIQHHDTSSSETMDSEKKGCAESPTTDAEGPPISDASREADGAGQEESMEMENQALSAELKSSEDTGLQKINTSNVDRHHGETTTPSSAAGERDDQVEMKEGNSVGESSSLAEIEHMETAARAQLAQDLMVSSDSDSSCGNDSDSDSSKMEKTDGTAAEDSTTACDSAVTQDNTAQSDGTSRQDKAAHSDSTEVLSSLQDTAQTDSTSSETAHSHSDSTSVQGKQAPSDLVNTKDEGAEGGEQRASDSTQTQLEDRKQGETETDSFSSEQTVQKSPVSRFEEKPEPTEVSNTSAASQTEKKTQGTEEEEVEWDDEDDYLLHLEEILTRIHQAFYAMIDEGSHSGSSPTAAANQEPAPSRKDSQPDLKSIIPYVRRKTLKECNIVFSGVVPLNTPPEKCQAHVVAKALGATIQPEIVGPKETGKKGPVTTHLVAAKPGTSKHKTAMRTTGIHIVSSAWLWACNERWERCQEQLFPLASDVSPSNANHPPEKHRKNERHRPNKRKLTPSKEQDEGETKKGTRGKKRRKVRGERAEESSTDGAAQASDGGASQLVNRRGSTFAETVPPLLTFSDEDLECMDKEVDELMAEEATGSEDETDDERDRRYRDTVLGSVSESSSSDSLSGEFPRGWGLRRKTSLHASDDDLEKRKREEIEAETEDTENELARFQKTVETFSPDSDTNNSSYAESIGSVDDEIAEAVEKEFLGSL